MLLRGDESSTMNPYSTLSWEMLCTTYPLLQTVQCLTTSLVTTRSVPANAAGPHASCGILMCSIFCLAGSATPNVAAFLFPSVF